MKTRVSTERGLLQDYRHLCPRTLGDGSVGVTRPYEDRKTVTQE